MFAASPFRVTKRSATPVATSVTSGAETRACSCVATSGGGTTSSYPASGWKYFSAATEESVGPGVGVGVGAGVGGIGVGVIVWYGVTVGAAGVGTGCGTDAVLDPQAVRAIVSAMPAAR